jgi:hypothetical protein
MKAFRASAREIVRKDRLCLSVSNHLGELYRNISRKVRNLSRERAAVAAAQQQVGPAEDEFLIEQLFMDQSVEEAFVVHEPPRYFSPFMTFTQIKRLNAVIRNIPCRYRIYGIIYPEGDNFEEGHHKRFLTKLVTYINACLQYFTENNANTYAKAAAFIDLFIENLMTALSKMMESYTNVYIDLDLDSTGDVVVNGLNWEEDPVLLQRAYIGINIPTVFQYALDGITLQPHEPKDVQAEAQGGGIKPHKLTKTKEKHVHKNRRYVLYLGPRGGKYIKTGGKYVGLAKL